MKKGFTLIELLAVIVILAIIALIATPIILGIIEDARKGSIESSANGYIDAVEYNSARNELKGDPIADGTYDVTKLEIDLDGEKPSSGIVTIEKGKVINATLTINNKTVYYNGTTPKVIDNKQEEYKETLLNGADPVLKDELVPVVILNDGVVLKANTKTSWYSYEDKMWANAVILFDNKDYKDGEIIPESNIKEYYVWIPRYAYKLWNVNGDDTSQAEKPIKIVFGDKAKTTGTNNGDMYLHPAFENFNTQGIWVGKFESSYNEETYTDSSMFLTHNTNYSAATDPSNIIIRPNVRNLGFKTFSEMHTLLFNSHRNLNSHVMTNMEWGATAYLTYSVYGRCNNNSCTRITLNNINTGYLDSDPVFASQWTWGTTITGCAAENIGDIHISNRDKCIHEYNTKKGYLASTTGNITGIYDMSGGGYEYVMGILFQPDGTLISGQNNWFNTGFKGIYGCPSCQGGTSSIIENTGGLDLPDSKYYNKYINKYDLNTENRLDFTPGMLGDATIEITNINYNINQDSNDFGTWFNSHANFINSSNNLFVRGTGYHGGFVVNILAFGDDNGRKSPCNTVRQVLAF